MEPIVENYPVNDIPQPPGISFWLNIAGRLTSIDGVHYELGRYTCPHIIEQGRGWVRAGKLTKELSPGDMFCIMNDGEVEYYDDPADPWIFRWLHLSGTGCDELMRSWGFTPSKPWTRPTAPERVLDSFSRIHSMAKNSAETTPNQLAAELFKLADLLFESEISTADKNAQAIALAQALIENQMHTGINVSELASLMNIDRTTLFKLFKSELTCSPVEYIRRQRINRACQMLRSTNRVLSDIAAICGFANDKYFIKTFRKLKGITPGEYKAKHKT